MKRVQMVGTQRSGSNVLRLMLDVGPEVSAPPSTHLLRVFTDALPTYGDLSVQANRHALLADAEELIRRNVLGWPEGPPPLTQLSNQPINSAASLLFATYDSEATRAGSHSWVCKSLENLHYMDQLGAADPDLGFIHLIRDGRDVAMSFQKAPIGPKDPHVQARKWAREQTEISEYTSANPERVIVVRYEDLTSDPETTMQMVHDRFDLGPVGEIHRFFESDMARRTEGLSDLWTNLRRPLMTSNSGKFRDPEHAPHVAAFEAVAATQLREFGYEPIFPVGSGRQVDWTEAEQNDLRLRKQRAQQNDLDTEARHKHYEHFVSLIGSRSSSEAGRPTATG